MKNYIRELIAYRGLLFNLTLNELKLRYRNSVLGLLWTILNPLFYLLILAVVFSQIMRFRIENYTIFLFAGLTSWMMIQQSVIIATSSIVNNQSMIKKVYVPKIVFPLSNVLARYIDSVIMTLVLLGFMVYFKADFTWSLLLIPVILLLHFLFSLGLSLISSVAHIKIRDVQHIIAIIFQALFFFSPIIYSLEVLPEKFRPFFLWNPFYYFIQTLRYPVYNGTPPPAKIFLAAFLLSLLIFLTGFYLFSRKEKYFVFHLS